jgi:NAD(P)-dependent dehydrogenase (short-subunit alcohol dehydrogenase family)
MTVLIVGARPNSLGTAVRDLLRSKGFGAATAGVSGEEHYLDVRDIHSIENVVRIVHPTDIIVTAGINEPANLRADGYHTSMLNSYVVNAVGPMMVLNEWLRHLEEYPKLKVAARAFVAISSNSAHIARRGSVPYCASKAALSMALRCAARELGGKPFLVYGYEPGLLEGTPMTQDTETIFGPAQSRMMGAEKGIAPEKMADLIVQYLLMPTIALNGTMLRIDAGEQ